MIRCVERLDFPSSNLHCSAEAQELELLHGGGGGGGLDPPRRQQVQAGDVQNSTLSVFTSEPGDRSIDRSINLTTRSPWAQGPRLRWIRTRRHRISAVAQAFAVSCIRSLTHSPIAENVLLWPKLWHPSRRRLLLPRSAQLHFTP